MELVKDSGILVNSNRLRKIKDLYKKNPREMVRQLMKMIIGEDELKKSSPTGKNGWKPIPEKIYEGVERKYRNRISKGMLAPNLASMNHKLSHEPVKR